MGLFGQSSPLDDDIEKATSEKNITEPWGVIMDICDKINSNPRSTKECLKSIMRRMAHNDPHVVIQAVTLLDACVNNCGKMFHLEVASREFENEFKRLLSKVQPQVAAKMRLLLKKWAENDFKNDPQLVLIPSLYQKLKSEGLDFTDAQKQTKPTTPAAALKDPNVVTSQQEEEDIAKAIELSLKDAKSSPKKQQTNSGTSYASLYPSFSGGNSGAVGGTTTGSSSIPSTETSTVPRKVRALYDFEAAEENELTFFAGDIITVIDDYDANWWKGYNSRGEGLFPSNFVTADLSAEPEKFDSNQKSKKSVQFEDESKIDEKTELSKLDDDKLYVAEVNEEKIDRLIHLLHEANPEDPSQDSPEMLRLEEEVNKMGPLIDTELEKVDKNHAQLTQLSSDLVDAINLYHTLMREPDRSSLPAMNFIPSTGYNPQPMFGGLNPAYGMPNMYHQPAANSMGPTSLPAMPPMSMYSQGPVVVNPPTPNQIANTITSTAGSGVFTPIPQQQPQMIPMQLQNGHSNPPHTHQMSLQNQPNLPQQTPHSQQPQQNQPQQFPQNNTNQAISTVLPGQQAIIGQQQPQMQPPQPTSHNPAMVQSNPNSTQPQPAINSCFFPSQTTLPGYGPQPSAMYGVSQVPGMAPGQFHLPPQQQQQPPRGLIHNNSSIGNNGLVGHPSQSVPMNSQTAVTMSFPPVPHMGMNIPMTHTTLGPTDSKSNIPIPPQQQR